MVTEEELAAMSPEEIAEFQKKNCIFRQIATGKVPAKTVYSDDDCAAVLDINPATKGHMLLMPKEHHSVMPQLPDYLTEHMFMVAKGLSQAALKGLQCRGTTIFVANGVAAGQRAPHFMIHIIPRTDDDGLQLGIPEKEFPKKELDAIAKVMKKALGVKEDAKPAAGEKKPAAKEAKKAEKKDAPKQPSKKKTPAKKDAFDLDAVTDMLAK